MSEEPLAAVVPKPRAQTAIAALRAEGVYDDDRSVYECGDETVAIPVTRYPAETEVIEVVRDEGEPRLRTLEDHLRERGWTDDELERAPGSWAVVGSVVLVDIGDALLALHGAADTVLAREGIDGAHREPSVSVIAGEGDTETVHVEHGTTYAMDLAEVMFSPGNKAERARMGEVVRGDEPGEWPARASGESEVEDLASTGDHREPGEERPAGREADPGEASDRASGESEVEDLASTGDHREPGEERPASREADERVLDAFAGIGYFALPMARAGARVTAVERNPAAFEYLLENAVRNGVQDRLRAYRGDNREVVPELASGADGFDRAVMGHYEAWESLEAVLPAVTSGGTVHLHEATPTELVPERPVERLESATAETGRSVEVVEVREIKGYSEGVAHVVVDARVA